MSTMMDQLLNSAIENVSVRLFSEVFLNSLQIMIRSSSIFFPIDTYSGGKLKQKRKI